ncbi:hypothetical protein [Pedobacter jeongneungensis]|uniref:hypothetical protein n=1 Tax=Pedobacter jeongneungensis TaxID=947309 RepID=UPI00046A4B66|nr:hypothetical protein [Pedobacter jeongneungensis]
MEIKEQETLLNEIARILKTEETITDLEELDRIHNLIYTICVVAMENQLNIIEKESQVFSKKFF